jgi:hypothetical protein
MPLDNPTLDSMLRSIVTKGEPTESQFSSASRSHNYLRDVLSSGQFGYRLVDDYLSGSYARGTAIYPLDDVDIVFEFDPKAYASLFRPDVDQVLQSFARAIRHRYKESRVEVQNRSVGLKLYHLDIDVVPAIATLEAGYVLVPDRRDGTWIRSAPKLHTAWGRELNKRTNGQFKPLVKLLKIWNRQGPQNAQVRSFLIETIAMRMFLNMPLNSVFEGAYLFFDMLSSFAWESKLSWNTTFGVQLGFWLGNSVPDIAETGINVAEGMEEALRERFIRRAVRSRDGLLAARNARYIETGAQHIAEAI